MRVFLLVSLFAITISCNSHGKLNFITKLPKTLKENSGIAYYKNNSAWFIEDHGNDNILYQVNFKGKLLRKLQIKNAENIDWEDITQDTEGNLYIADIGNNNNDRNNLTIYKIPNPETSVEEHIIAEEITYHYPEQTKFPPKKECLVYDAESLFYYNEYLYIITKNRAKPFSGKALIYKIPSIPGNYAAEIVGAFTPCKNEEVCQITSAAVSPDGKKIVLLGYGFLWLFSEFDNNNFTKGKCTTINLKVTTQLESVCFKDNNTLLISDEERGKTGRNLYSIDLK